MLRTALLPFFFLFGASVLMAIKTALKDFSSAQLDDEFAESKLHFLLFRKIEALFSRARSEKTSDLRDFLNLSIIIAFISYGVSGAIFLASGDFYPEGLKIVQPNTILFNIAWLGYAVGFILLIALATYFLFHFFALHAEIATLKLFSLIASCYLAVLFPIVYPILWLEKKLSPTPNHKQIIPPSEKLKLKLSEFIEEADDQDQLEPLEKRLLSSMAKFGGLVAREIMIPRPDIVCLQEKTTVYEALKIFAKEGYSRIPLFGESIDDITAVLLYKDLMEFTVNALEKDALEKIQNTDVSTLANEILYAPENKKIRDLFQEMRTGKIHSAIVVNEYGCTEGLITIEDILEELVGSEIRDEHDEGEESLYQESEDKSWIVNASMSIIDVEKELGIKLPHGPEYETIAGFISLQARCIPKPGTIIHGNQFHIEVLKSDERQILEVKITPEKTNLSESS
jgi:putative hemolysin